RAEFGRRAGDLGGRVADTFKVMRDFHRSRDEPEIAGQRRFGEEPDRDFVDFDFELVEFVILVLVQHEDDELDQLEIEIDEIAIGLLSKAPLASDLRFITAAMKISHDLERVGDAATKIARPSTELSP